MNNELILNRKEIYQEEHDKMLKMMLEERFFKIWKNKELREDSDVRDFSLIDDIGLELFITSTCNQHCEYCYLVKHGNELYPQECNNPETILHNLNILFDWFIENDMYIPRIDLFTGEIWHAQFGLDVLDLIYKKILEGFKTEFIMIPSNCSFLKDPVQTGRIEQRLHKFANKNIRIAFSISIDGKIIEEQARPHNDASVNNDAFYERMFLFAKHHEFYFHPMVAAIDVDRWIENHKWWVEECEKYDIDPDQCIMMLEVRNNNWTEESIKHYNEFMDYLLERYLSKYSTEGLAYSLIMDPNYRARDTLTGYIPYFPGMADSFPGCSVSLELTVRLGDLAICPCHRTAYKKYLYGHFKVENDKITDIVSNNVYMAERILFMNNNLCSLKCDTCPFNPVCIKGCFGSQLETNDDPFVPIESVCNFYYHKISHIFHKLKEYGIDEIWKTISPYEPGYTRAQEFLAIMNRVEEEYGLGEN